MIALGKIGGRDALRPLLDSLEDCDWLIRKTAADALGDLGDQRAVAHLTRHVKDVNWRVREPAANALRKLAGENPEP